jgi:Tol biopolymer transport system component
MNPAVSPDGNWLAFQTYVNQQEDLYVMRTDGTDRRQLTNDIYKDRGPLWSPDSKKISFHSNRSGIYEVWSINSDGSGLTQLTQTPEWNVATGAWAPDGLSMAYHSQDGNCYILDLGRAWDEQVPQRLPQLEGDQAFLATSWSPDGKNLAGVVINKPGIVIYSLEVGQYRRLTDIGRNPRWLPDSRRLLFRHSGDTISLLDSESGKIQEQFLTVARPDRISQVPSISGDGRDLYFTRARVEADIWMLTLNEEQK